MQWAVSQAISFRRMHVRGDIVLHQNSGWASGGWMSDSLIDGAVGAGPQQQWISRNTEWGKWTGANWNMVFVGVVNPPQANGPLRPTPRSRRHPLFARSPIWRSMRRATTVSAFPRCAPTAQASRGAPDRPPATIPLSQFYIAHSGADTAVTINAQLAQGKHLLLTPGIYDLRDTIRVTRAGTVVLGLGYATLRPVTGLAAMTTADVDGLTLSGLLFDAGVTNSPVLLEVGPGGSKASHTKRPIFLHDVYFRVGGAAVGRASVSLSINSHDTIVDHTWVWRADHGSGVGSTATPLPTAWW